MPRSLYAVILAALALVAAPVIATAITLSASTDAQLMNSVLWAWAGAGVTALLAMVVFGALVVRRATRVAAVPAPVEPRVEVTQAVFA